ncbi:hypothetical protein [Butyrivibrio sp. LC3010]|uniref:hypothetical protein n=1 Tax=Butyrivibrio sp. LC3010 TaxID=1280680 RepID=UPI00041C673C|nr:hypothetical protein [Butyrivibrio sp. LC3010]
MEQAYKHEIEQFKTAFSWLKDKRIVLYGIGRYTATILSELSNQFDFVGLLDKDPENIGKEINGIKVVDLKYAEKNADLIIINTQEMYWNTILRRISGSQIPIYFRSGQQAISIDSSIRDADPYWELDGDGIYQKALNYDVVSFDIFDTIIMRKTLLPKDVFLILEKRAYEEKGIYGEIAKTRTEINAICINELLNFDEIYDLVQERLNLSNDDKEYLKKLEMSIEKDISIPRLAIVELVNRIAKDKDVFLISDMYLPIEFIKELLTNAGVDSNLNIWISCEKKATKKQGDLWELYKKTLGKKKALHIGDNEQSDVAIPSQLGIDSIHILSAFQLWEKSTMSRVLSKILTKDDFCAGLIAARLFENPFALKQNSGHVVIGDSKTLGYVYFGSLIYVFLKWIMDQTKEKGGRPFFLARDGYWLKRDYDYMQNLYSKGLEKANNSLSSDYLAISRRIVLVSAIDEPDGWERLISFSFIGDFKYFCRTRLSYELPVDDEHAHENITMPIDYKKVNGWLESYKKDIIADLEKQKKRYMKYLENKKLSEQDFVIDLWFNGNNQLYLSRTIKKHLTGLYLVANLSPENSCAINNTLIPCFQEEDDPLALKSSIRKQAAFVESILTAPYGMISSVNDDGAYICEPKMENQKRWVIRVNINEGIKSFFRDYIDLWDGEITTQFVNDFWDEICDRGIELSDNLKKDFFCDNVLVKRQETSVFE